MVECWQRNNKGNRKNAQRQLIVKIGNLPVMEEALLFIIYRWKKTSIECLETCSRFCSKQIAQSTLSQIFQCEDLRCQPLCCWERKGNVWYNKHVIVTGADHQTFLVLYLSVNMVSCTSQLSLELDTVMRIALDHKMGD